MDTPLDPHPSATIPAIDTLLPSTSDLSTSAASLASRLWGSLRGVAATPSSSTAHSSSRRHGSSRSSSSRRGTHGSIHSGLSTPLTSSPIINHRGGPISVADRRIAAISEFLQAVEKKGPEGVLKEFAKVDHFFDNTASHKAFHANMAKNRYSDVPCIDDSRIRLRIGTAAHGDYIHANRVLHPFICTQGPTQHTAHDFWRMVFQERVESIVMLCRPVEDCKPKCTVYWPEKVGETKRFPTVVVTNEGKEIDEDFASMTFRVELSTKYDAAADGFGGDEIRPLTVRLIRWTEWPDRGVPDKKACLVPLRLLQRVRQPESPQGRVVVHCSAGIGRTGSLIAIEMALQRLYAGKSIAMDNIVRELRCQRSHSIQTESQYLYIHRVLVEAGLELGRSGALSQCEMGLVPERTKLPSAARNAGNSFLRRCERLSSLASGSN